MILLHLQRDVPYFHYGGEIDADVCVWRDASQTGSMGVFLLVARATMSVSTLSCNDTRTHRSSDILLLVVNLFAEDWYSQGTSGTSTRTPVFT